MTEPRVISALEKCAIATPESRERTQKYFSILREYGLKAAFVGHSFEDTMDYLEKVAESGELESMLNKCRDRYN